MGGCLLVVVVYRNPENESPASRRFHPPLKN